MFTTLVICILIASLSIAASSRTSAAPKAAAGLKVRKGAGPDFPVLRPRCSSARRAVPWYRSATHSWQRLRDAVRLAGPSPKVRGHSCGFARYAAGEWQSRARTARFTYKKWLTERVLQEQESYLEAVEEVQRVYLGSRGWLQSCPRSEGGWGRWVLNREGSGAGGWLQFMESTFWRMFYAAKAEAEAKGFVVPRSAASWYSPLGQALAGGWALTHGATHEWSGSTC